MTNVASSLKKLNKWIRFRSKAKQYNSNWYKFDYHLDLKEQWGVRTSITYMYNYSLYMPLITVEISRPIRMVTWGMWAEKNDAINGGRGGGLGELSLVRAPASEEAKFVTMGNCPLSPLAASDSVESCGPNFNWLRQTQQKLYSN